MYGKSIIILAVVAAALVAYFQFYPADDDTITLAQLQIYSSQTDGSVLKAEPYGDALTVRELAQYETFITSNRVKNGYILVGMEIDGASGWVKKADSREIVSIRGHKSRFRAAFYDFQQLLLNMAALIAIVFGVVVGWLTLKLFKKTDIETLEYFSILLAGAGAVLATNQIEASEPFNYNLLMMRTQLALGAAYVTKILPTIISMTITTAFVRKGDVLLVVLVPISIIGSFVLFYSFGLVGGWW